MGVRRTGVRPRLGRTMEGWGQGEDGSRKGKGWPQGKGGGHCKGKRRIQGQCWNCGKVGHSARKCPDGKGKMVRAGRQRKRQMRVQWPMLPVRSVGAQRKVLHQW